MLQLIRMKITSPAFKNNDFIPQKYTCNGENVNPELRIDDVPADAKCLVLIVDDPDAPNGTFTHWTLWDINPTISVIKENGITIAAWKSDVAREGKTDFGRSGYSGPCPPVGNVHHYHFRLYALDMGLYLKEGADRASLESAIKGHVIEQSEIIGLYQR
jgi:Raf kinase inhibitor-like YbhB/YbcL family protein